MDSVDFSDNEDIPEVSFTLDIKPYMYEPESTECEELSESESSELKASDDEQGQETGSMACVNADLTPEWCSYSLCPQMPTQEERTCCKDINILDEKMGEMNRITSHEGFIANCLNMHVLETTFYEYAEEHGQGDAVDIHRLYRLVAYIRFIRWVWRRLGKRNRKVIPACTVSTIRKHFPSEEYTGFTYPRF